MNGKIIFRCALRPKGSKPLRQRLHCEYLSSINTTAHIYSSGTYLVSPFSHHPVPRLLCPEDRPGQSAGAAPRRSLLCQLRNGPVCDRRLTRPQASCSWTWRGVQSSGNCCQTGQYLSPTWNRLPDLRIWTVAVNSTSTEGVLYGISKVKRQEWTLNRLKSHTDSNWWKMPSNRIKKKKID